MTVGEIISLLDTGEFKIELDFDNKVKDDIVLYGAVTKKGDNSGLGRQEFVFRSDKEKEELLDGIKQSFMKLATV
ncbi:hypothetical protein [Tuberibacillus sp. Marseille-P3662]|uniref:hypothetical protein n=1 Tax=Tuberibacillus sp. Marseille-P3662 TaxID=1965358 RepID=UPI000A1CA624|nr:hypothetical protein [Tuberibacillus sp. Marseille-P3662]